MARAWTLTRRPDEKPAENDFRLTDIDLPPLEPGMVRVRNRFLSVDPYMRGRMRDEKSYVPPFQLDTPLDGGAVGEVIESRSDDLEVGDRVLHMSGWRDEAVGPAGMFTRLPSNDAPIEAYLGILGLTGRTAWFGLMDVAQARAGETLFVSAAAGAVGSALVQIARKQGLRVIGSAGGPAKTALVRDLGADAVIDYKAEVDLKQALAKVAPDGIDLYFDNVGGEHLDAALGVARQDARFALCGMIGSYNDARPTPMRHLMRIVSNRITLRGFIVSDFADRFAEFDEVVTPWVLDGSIRGVETVRDGLEGVAAAFVELFEGGNTGKMLIRL